MTAIEFWNIFKNMLSDPKVCSAALEKWHDRGDFTEFIVDKLDKILKEKYETSKEYYNIDLIGWSQLKKKLPPTPVSKYRLKKHLWRLEVAIEHENDQSDWTDELIKLLFINCPLRIVIGYIPADVASNSTKMNNVLRYASKSIQLASGNNVLISNDQDFVLIFGKNSSHVTDISANTYSAYKYDVETKSFIVLE